MYNQPPPTLFSVELPKSVTLGESTIPLSNPFLIYSTQNTCYYRVNAGFLGKVIMKVMRGGVEQEEEDIQAFEATNHYYETLDCSIAHIVKPLGLTSFRVCDAGDEVNHAGVSLDFDFLENYIWDVGCTYEKLVGVIRDFILGISFLVKNRICQSDLDYKLVVTHGKGMFTDLEYKRGLCDCGINNLGYELSRVVKGPLDIYMADFIDLCRASDPTEFSEKLWLEHPIFLDRSRLIDYIGSMYRSIRACCEFNLKNSMAPADYANRGLRERKVKSAMMKEFCLATKGLFGKKFVWRKLIKALGDSELNYTLRIGKYHDNHASFFCFVRVVVEHRIYFTLFDDVLAVHPKFPVILYEASRNIADVAIDRGTNPQQVL